MKGGTIEINAQFCLAPRYLMKPIPLFGENEGLRGSLEMHVLL